MEREENSKNILRDLRGNISDDKLQRLVTLVKVFVEVFKNNNKKCSFISDNLPHFFKTISHMISYKLYLYLKRL